MTDRELLELAAKAAGLTLEWDGDPEEWMPIYYEGKTYRAWNPLNDNDDALRLAVKLKLEIRFHADFVSVDSMKFVDYNDDISAAVRKGIVLAAIEISRGMK